MKILIAHNFYKQRGGEDVTFEKERDLLRNAGHDVVEYCRNNQETQLYVSALAKLSLAKNTIWSGESYRQFRDILQREAPQIVHVHNTFALISPSIFQACSDMGIPVVQTMHNYRMFCPSGDFFRNGRVCEECKEHSLMRGLAHACYHDSRSATATMIGMIAVNRWKRTWVRMVNRFILVTQFSRKKFCESQMPAEKLTVKPNFVHPDPGPGSGSRDYVLFVGRLSREKGADTMLSAWTALPRSIPLRVVGDGPLRGELETEAIERGLSNVTFHGQLGSEDVMRMMHGASLLVFPSQCYENCPVTILEAFACSVPVVASRLGAMQELVENGRTGFHFQPRDPLDLAQKVERAWSRQDHLATMGRAARAEYEQKYTAARNYQMLMQIYASVLPSAS